LRERPALFLLRWAGYHRASASVPTRLDALALKDHALKAGHCSW
jgi:hypothetical protein